MNRRICLGEYYFGRYAKFYSIAFLDKNGIPEECETEKFFLKYERTHKKQADFIDYKIEKIADHYSYGVQEEHFKDERKKLVRFNLWALPRYEDYGGNKAGTLRLFCLRYGTGIIILGNGGMKPRKIRTYQEVPELELAADVLDKVAIELDKKSLDGEIKIRDDEIIFDEEMLIEIKQ